jgi:hypothetical protein
MMGERFDLFDYLAMALIVVALAVLASVCAGRA